MTTIKEIGSLCLTDSDGYIINHADWNKINPIFLAVINDVVHTYRTLLQDDLHSIYIRGSIPKGIGIEGVADLDTIAVTKHKPKKQQVKRIKEVEQALTQNHHCVDGIELSVFGKEDILNTTSFSIISFILQTHSICVFGEDLIPRLPRYKANEALANDHLIHLQGQIKNACDDLQDNSDREDIKDCCKWIMKIIVRAGLALVITKENTYTRDLFPAYKRFSEYFPDKESDMRRALEYAITPIIDTNVLLLFLNEFGTWMISEADKWLQFYNPTRELNMKIV